AQQRFPAPRLGVDDRAALELCLYPVIFDTALTVQAQVLDDGAERKSWLHTISSQHVSELPDGAGQCQDGAV
ncbi:hypothetical protein C6A85_71080, partial [Mycobacterium sp. ITM-2017-0098]